jgi:hypothetical protein
MPGNYGKPYGKRVPDNIKQEAAILYKKTYSTQKKTMRECVDIVNATLGINTTMSSLNRWVDKAGEFDCDKTGKKRDYYKTKIPIDLKKKVVSLYDELMRNTDLTQVAAVAQINRELDCNVAAPNIMYWKRQPELCQIDEIIGKKIYYDDALGMMRIEGSQLLGVGAIETEPAAVAVV